MLRAFLPCSITFIVFLMARLTISKPITHALFF
jgi:hypothetical protein